MKREGRGEEMDERLMLLVQQVAERKVVPFLGAGFSYEATDPSEDEGWPAPKIRTDQLTKKLTCELKAAHRKRTLKGLVSRSDDWSEMPFGQAAELYEFLWGRRNMVKRLGLGSWSNLRPAMSHQGLAVLVLEGLVQEIITTNYDCLIEKAIHRLHRPPSPQEEDAVPYQVIADVDQYQEHGARVGDGRSPLVNLFKVNGCLKACSADPEPDARQIDLQRAAEKLALTEEDVQEWRDKAWARDLVRDRMRARSLLFVGFEGADPIVRHHVVTVVREFRTDRDSRQERYDEGRSPETAQHGEEARTPVDRARTSGRSESERAQIYVATFEDHLSFPQLQMLRARHAPTADSTEAADEPCAAVRRKAFTGADAPQLASKHGDSYGDDPDKKQLGADLFMAELVARVLERVIIEQYLADESPVASYLNGLLGTRPTGLLDATREMLLRSPGSPDGSRPGEGGSLLAAWLRPQVSRFPRSVLNSHWARFAACLDGSWTPRPEGDTSEPDRYRALLQSPVKLPLALVILALVLRQDLDGSNVPKEQVECRWGPFAGIWTTCDGPSGTTMRRLVMLADLREGSVEGLRQPLEQVRRFATGPSSPGDSTAVSQAIVVTLAHPNAQPTKLSLTGSTRRDEEADESLAATIQVIPDWKLLQGSQQYGELGVNDILDNVRTALAAPQQIVDEGAVRGSWRARFGQTTGAGHDD